jgi:signal peptidase I
MSKDKVARFKKGFIQDWVDAILWAFVVAMIIRNYTFQNFKIPSESMVETLLVGDYLVANKLKYFYSDPQRGDIVTFRSPEDPFEQNPYGPRKRNEFIRLVAPVYWDKTNFKLAWVARIDVVKRVIGMPGDKIEIRDKLVYLNDELYMTEKEIHLDNRRPFPREFVHCSWTWEGKKYQGSRDNFGPVTVPDGHYFVMGDNRDNSKDSRFWGFLSRKDITGTPALIFFSRDEDEGTVRWERSFTRIR